MCQLPAEPAAAAPTRQPLQVVGGQEGPLLVRPHQPHQHLCDGGGVHVPHQLLQQLLPLLKVLHDVLRAPQQQAAHHPAEVASKHAVEGARGLRMQRQGRTGQVRRQGGG
jgi:hypothetical protein